MSFGFEPGSLKFPLFLLLAAAAGFFAASRAAVDALTHNPHPHPGRLAIGHWIPITCVALLAVLFDRPGVALAIVFSTSIACLTLALGVSVYVTPMNAPPGEGRGLWMFVLPASMLTLIAGLSGTITVIHAGALLILGGVLLPMAMHRSEYTGESIQASTPLIRWRGLASVQLALAILLAGLGAWAAVTAAGHLEQKSRFFSATLIATGIIAPALVFPVLVTSGTLAQRNGGGGGQSTLALTLFVQIVLLNLCLLLPLVALVWYVRPVLFAIEPNVDSTYAAIAKINPPIIFPMLTWRLDNVLLTVLGVMLLPVSMGRWMLGRYEGMGLLIAYGMYLLLALVMSVR